MHTLLAIIIASLIGGALSLAAAAVFAYSARLSWVPILVSYAIGALLGAAFLEVLPHAFESAAVSGASISSITTTLLVGILMFFVLEKLVLWRHCHTDHCEAHAPVVDHGHDHGRSGLMITVGDTFHNFVDGVIIAAAFMTNFELGVVTALAIIAHEIPQEVGDFLILLHSGYSKRRAFLVNLLASLATVVGGVLAYFALDTMRGAVPYTLGIAAASMIYVAVADLIPGLHKRAELLVTLQQVTLIGLGVATVALTGWLLGGHA